MRRRVRAALGTAGAVVPGLVLAGALGVAATAIADWVGVGLLGYATSPISAVPLAVLLGLVVRNSVGVPGVADPGLQFCLRRLLRAGVALLGIRLSLVEAGVTGVLALPVVVVCIAVALLVVGALTRLLRLPRQLGTLIAVGTSICGITAIVAVAPVIEADDDETSYAVATIALFGMVALLTYPVLAHLIFDDPRHAGLFLGTAIHDTSQVAGAGLTYQQQFGAPGALDTAVVTKLVRNLCMVGVIPLVRVLHHRRRADGMQRGSGASRFTDLVPLFVLGFLGMTVLRTVGDLGDRAFGFADPTSWLRVIAILQRVAELTLLLAMAAVGLGTSLRRLRVLGFRPLGVGLVAAVCVGSVSILLIRVLAVVGMI